MIGIDDDERILQAHLFIVGNGIQHIFIVEIWNVLTVFIGSPTQNNVSQSIPRGFYFLAMKKESLLILCRIDSVKHNSQITRSWIFHADWSVNT